MPSLENEPAFLFDALVLPAGDAAVKAGDLNGLQLEPGDHPGMGPGIMALAAEVNVVMIAVDTSIVLMPRRHRP